MDDVAIIGGGPAGLFAAELLAGAGWAVTVYDRMPSMGRKFLLAGRGGLNLTHSEPLERFLGRYGAGPVLCRAVAAFPPAALRAWCDGLGQASLVGSSGRVFPAGFKASPLLRAWLGRLAGLGVGFCARHRWLGWDEAGALRFETPSGGRAVRAGATLLALGGGSWPRMGSDAAWVPILAAAGVAVSPLRPANVGVACAWSGHFRDRFAGQPLKRVVATVDGISVPGEAMITAEGLEGGAIYALSRPIRAALDRGALDRGAAAVAFDLRPDLDGAALQRRMGGPGLSQANALRRAGLSAAAAALVRETGGSPKRAVVRVTGLQPLERAISTAGGVRFEAVDDALMLRERPGVFVAGEMLDWEAPTGGYLLQACFSTAALAAAGIDARLRTERG